MDVNFFSSKSSNLLTLNELLIDDVCILWYIASPLTHQYIPPVISLRLEIYIETFTVNNVMWSVH